jgi:hypothetical protein
VRLALLAPEWDRPCEVCESFIWETDEPGRVKRTPDGNPVPRTIDSIPTRCAECAKVPTWAKKAGKDWRELRKLARPDMTDANREAFEFYSGCAATGKFPDDALVNWYSAAIRDVEKEAERRPLLRSTAATETLIALLTIKLRGR